jgi:hypothetical protein
MNPLLTAHLSELAKDMTAGQREQFMAQAQQRIEASGLHVSPETLNGAVSLLGMVGSGRLSVPGLSSQLIRTLKYGDPQKMTDAIARELSPQGRAHRAAQFKGAVEATAPVREVTATKLTSALNKVDVSAGGKGDLGDRARARGLWAARFAGALGSQVKASAASGLEKTASQRAAAQASARSAVQTASEAVGTANTASSSLRQQVNQVGVGTGATGQVTRLVGNAGRTVGSAGAVVDLAGVILDALDDALRPNANSDGGQSPTTPPLRPDDI